MKNISKTELTHGNERLLLQADLITNEVVRIFTKRCLGQLPQHFWTQPSSSSGKHHPPDERGVGGLALHTYRASVVAEILMKAHPLPVPRDTVRVAILLHDTARYGFKEEPSGHSLDNHPELSAKFLVEELENYSCLTPEAQDIMENAIGPIRCHMGHWGKKLPKTDEDWVVHLSDMIATQYYGV